MKQLDSAFVKNTSSLIATKLFRFLGPLIVLPLLSMRADVSSVGDYFFYITLAAWIAMLVEYGFVFSAAKEASEKRGTPAALAKISADVLSAKLFLSLLCVAVAPVIAGMSYFSSYSSIYPAITAGILIGLQPLWFFQGIEKSYYLTFLDAGFMTAQISVTFFVEKLGLSNYFYCLVGFRALQMLALNALLVRKTSFSSVLGVSFSGAKIALTNGFSLFQFKLVSSVYTTTSALLVASFVSPAVFAHYSLCEKIVRSIVTFISSIGQAFYARMCFSITQSYHRYLSLIKLSLLCNVVLAFVMVIVLNSFAMEIVTLLMPAFEADNIIYLQIFTILIPLVAISTVFGMQGLVIMGRTKEFNRSILFSAVLGCFFILLSLYFNSAMYVIFSILLTELMVAIMMVYFFIKEKHRVSALH